MSVQKMPNLAVLGMIGGAIDAVKENTFADLDWAESLNAASSGNACICVRLTLDSSLRLVEELNMENEVALKVYADGSGSKLNVHVHGKVNFDFPVLVNMNVDLKPVEDRGIITLHVFPANNPVYTYHGHMWFGDVQMVFGAVSNGMTEIHSVSIFSRPHMQARYEAGQMSAFAHFLDGFTFVFASSEVSLPDNSAFFRFRKGFLDTQAVSITALGMEVESGDFYKIGDIKYESSSLVVDQTDHIALMYAFREGVGAFNLAHLIKTSSTEKDPAKFAKACWKRISKMVDEGLFTLVDTQKGMFANPTLKLLLSL